MFWFAKWYKCQYRLIDIPVRMSCMGLVTFRMRVALFATLVQVPMQAILACFENVKMIMRSLVLKVLE